MKGSPKRRKNAIVYGIAVEDCPEYYANGLLVSNCHALTLWRTGISKYGFGGKVISNTSTPSGNIAPVIEPDGTLSGPKYDTEAEFVGYDLM